MKKQNKKKTVTIDDLAGMTQRGVDLVHTEIKNVRGEVKNVQGDVSALRREMNERFDVVELKLIGAHDRRLDKIEDDMRIIKTALHQKLSVTFPRYCLRKIDKITSQC